MIMWVAPCTDYTQMYCAPSFKTGVFSTTRSLISSLVSFRAEAHSSPSLFWDTWRMQPRNYKQAPHVCTLPSSTSSRHTISYPVTNCGNTCAAATCLIDYSPSFKTCITQMNTHCWTGTNKQVYSQSLVWSKAAPSPLCFFLSTWTMSTTWLRGCRARSRAFLISLCQSCCLQTTFLFCPMSTTSCRPCSTSSESMHDREYAKIWCDVLQLQVWWFA